MLRTDNRKAKCNYVSNGVGGAVQGVLMRSAQIPRPGEYYRDAHGGRYVVLAVVRAYDRKRNYVSIHLRGIEAKQRKRKR